MILYCCGCSLIIQPRLTTGVEIYPHREDLSELNFWVCDDCGNYVGCHRDKISSGITPLGSIPSPEIRKYRKRLHNIIDPMWKTGLVNRSKLYENISLQLGYEYHTGQVNSWGEYQNIKEILCDIATELHNNEFVKIIASME